MILGKLNVPLLVKERLQNRGKIPWKIIVERAKGRRFTVYFVTHGDPLRRQLLQGSVTMTEAIQIIDEIRSVWDYELEEITLPGDWQERASVQRATQRWDSRVVFDGPAALKEMFRLG